MVGRMLLHCKSLGRFKHNGGRIKAMLEEAKNEQKSGRRRTSGMSKIWLSPYKESSSMPTFWVT
uniref:Ubiquinol oxidase n=1 Tax=Nelumbo nucifera TaxID=4432 RepID=A0A822XIW2_NELNU|nr:TPA_asm: hypothetical protein HUJ06_020389 [Nelumbo nucifera]